MFDAYATEEVVWIQGAPLDEWGEPIGEKTEVYLDAHVEWRARIVRDFRGSEVVAAGSVIFPNVPGPTNYVQVVKREDKLRIRNVEHQILGYADKADFETHAFEVYFA